MIFENYLLWNVWEWVDSEKNMKMILRLFDKKLIYEGSAGLQIEEASAMIKFDFINIVFILWNNNNINKTDAGSG